MKRLNNKDAVELLGSRLILFVEFPPPAMLDWIEIPADVLLEVCTHLDLQDSTSLLNIHSTWRSLLSTKDFWFKALDRVQTVHRQPIPCTLGVDIPNLALDELKRLAVHAYRLLRNWSSPHPVPVSVSSFAFGENYSEVCVIHGTPLLVAVNDRCLACWDTTSGLCLATLVHNITENARYSFGGSKPFPVARRKCLVALSYHTRSYLGLVVVELDYRDPTELVLSHSFSHEFFEENHQFSRTSVALDDKRVGTVFALQETSASYVAWILVYSNYRDRITRRISLGRHLRPRSDGPKCMLHNNEFYVVGQNEQHPSTLICAPAEEPQEARFERKVEALFPGGWHQMSCISPAGPMLMVAPTYGVVAVSCRTCMLHPSASPDGRSNYLCFLPTDETRLKLTPNLPDGIDEEPEFLRPALHRLDDDMKPRVYAVGTAAGRCAAVILRALDKYKLGLVRYNAQPAPHTSFHELDTGPVAINRDTGKLALDDILGVLYVINRGRDAPTTLSVLRFA